MGIGPGIVYIERMDVHPPTYHLGPDFDSRLEKFVEGVIADGLQEFSLELSGIDAFLERVRSEPSSRDAHELRSTDKRRYLLEAISIKVHDRVNREAFNKAKDTLIIIPDCLSLHNPKCKKKDLKTGDKCRLCTPTCQAFQVEKLAAKYGAQCAFSKRKLEKQMEYYSKKSGDIGVVGIACILMLALGMRSASEVGVPARGVPLDYCGCEHWNDTPFASSFPIARLEQILREKYEYQHSTTHD
jgi:hypothetical protein